MQMVFKQEVCQRHRLQISASWNGKLYMFTFRRIMFTAAQGIMLENRAYWEGL